MIKDMMSSAVLSVVMLVMRVFVVMRVFMMMTLSEMLEARTFVMGVGAGVGRHGSQLKDNTE